MKILVSLLSLFVLVLGGLVAYFEYTPPPTGAIPEIVEDELPQNASLSHDQKVKIYLVNKYFLDRDGIYNNSVEGFRILQELDAQGVELSKELLFIYYIMGENPAKWWQIDKFNHVVHALYIAYLNLKGLPKESEKKMREISSYLATNGNTDAKVWLEK